MEPRHTTTMPPKWVRQFAITAMGLHVCLVGLSGIQSAGIPETVDGVLSLSAPYLQSTRFGFDAESLAFTNGGAEDRAVELQFLNAEFFSPGAGINAWELAGADQRPGLASADRTQRFLKSAVTMAENDLYGLAAHWLEPVAANRPEATAVRLTLPPTLMTTVADDQEPPPYEARLIRDPDDVNPVAWVHLQPPRLASIAAEPTTYSTAETTRGDAPVFDAPASQAGSEQQ